MHKYSILLFFLFICIKDNAQDSLAVGRIDSMISENERQVATIYQMTQKSRIETMHGRNPEFEGTTYKYVSGKIPVMIIDMSFSPGDTDIIIYYYFHAGQLIKAKNVYYGNVKGQKFEEYFYYDNQRLIFSSFNEEGPMRKPDYYIKRANDILRKLKKKPVRFTL